MRKERKTVEIPAETMVQMTGADPQKRPRGRPRTREPGDWVTRTVELHHRHDKWIREAALARGISVSQVVREMIEKLAGFNVEKRGGGTLSY
jgi:hypothetical protein